MKLSNPAQLPFSRWEKVADRPDEGLSIKSILKNQRASSPSSALRAPSPNGGRAIAG